MPSQQAIHHENRREEQPRNNSAQAFAARLDGHRKGEGHRGGGSPFKHALQRGHLMELEIRKAEPKNDQYRNQREPEDRRHRASHTPEFRAHKDGQIHLICPRQNPAHCNRTKKLFLGHPLLFDNDNLARPCGQPATKGSERDMIEGTRELEQSRPYGLFGLTHA
jgi:hypothetical protein